MNIRIQMILLTALLGLFSSAATAEVVLDFGLYSSDKPSTMIRKFRPVLDSLERDLSKRLEEPVTIRTQVARSYKQGVNDLARGKVDFSRVGPASYVFAKQLNGDISILAVEQKGGRKVFNGVICVRTDSSIRNVQDLAGTRFAFGNEKSTIGRYLSQLYLVRHGIKASDLAYYEYLDRHDRVATAVALGNFDAGALKEDTFLKVAKNGGESLRSVAVFPNVTKPWLARSQLPQRLAHALREALLALDDREALKALKIDGFLEGEDQDYAVTRMAIEQNELFFE